MKASFVRAVPLGFLLMIGFGAPEMTAASSPIFGEESPPEPTEPSGGTTEPDENRIRELVEAGDHDAALDALREAIAGAGGESPTLRLLEARLLDRMGKGWEALRVYRRAFDDPELGARARGEAHDLHVRRGEFASAERLTREGASPEAGADPADVRRLAYLRSVQGEFAEAVRLLSRAELEDDQRAAILRANALLALGERDSAQTLYLGVLEDEADPQVRQAAHFGLGQVARLRGGRAVRAMQDENAVLLGEAPWAELDWGHALRALGRRSEARARLRSAAEAAPALEPTVQLALARLDEEEGRVDQALEHLAAALTGSVADFLAWTRLGDLLLQEGEEEAGIQAYRSALALFPEFPPAAERLSRALVARGRWEEASDEASTRSAWELPDWTWDRLLDGDLPFYEVVADRSEIPPDDPRRTVLALVQLRAAFPAGALGWAEGGEGTVLASVRAEALEQVGREEEAERAWSEMLSAGFESSVARERLAHLAFARDREDAAEHWNELFRLHPRAVRARLRQARQLERAEDWEAALAAYRAADEANEWLLPEERRRLRVARDDLEATLQEEEEARAD